MWVQGDPLIKDSLIRSPEEPFRGQGGPRYGKVDPNEISFGVKGSLEQGILIKSANGAMIGPRVLHSLLCLQIQRSHTVEGYLVGAICESV